MTTFIMTGCRVRFTVAWLITAQSYPDGRMRGNGLLYKEVGVLIISTWFAMRSCPWIKRDLVLYLCICGTISPPFAFLCDRRVMGSM